MKKVKLTHGMFALVDDGDFERVSKHKWHFDSVGYANVHNRTISIRMHRFIMGLKKGDKRIVDHKNGDGLDNRRENLRICTHSQNLVNSNKPINNTSGFKGVYFNKGSRGKNGQLYRRKKPWVAQIVKNRKAKNLGYFFTAREAAECYNIQAKEFFKEFAKLNEL